MKTLLLPAPAHSALYTERLRQAAYTRAVHQMCPHNEAIIESGCYLLSACYYYSQHIMILTPPRKSKIRHKSVGVKKCHHLSPNLDRP